MNTLNTTTNLSRFFLLLCLAAFAATGCDATDLIEQVGTGGAGEASTDDVAQETALFHAEAGDLININTATAGELDTLPRIGPTTAARIIAEREANGAYTFKQDLMRVRGIGAGTLAGVEALISIGDGTLGGGDGAGDGGAAGGDADECEGRADGLVNLNTAGVPELDTLPGVGPSTAGRIVADRDANGPFAVVSDITRVRGIGSGTLGRLANFATVGADCAGQVDDGVDGAGDARGEGDEDGQDEGDACDIGRGLVNINTADARTLDSLPGIGPSTAARILADRDANGLFAVVSDLTRIRGIGDGTINRLRAFATVGCVDFGQAGGGDDEIPEAPADEVRKVHLNDGDLAELMTLPGVDAAAAQVIADHTRTHGLFTTLAEIEQAASVDTSGWAAGTFTLAAHRVYFTPFDDGAGFADQNRAKTLPLDDGAGNCAQATANIVDAFVDLVNRTPDGGLIQLAIYGYSVRTPEHRALVEAVENRGVRLQVSIDTSVKNSQGVPYSNDEIAALRNLDGEVEVRTIRFRTKTLHEKFAIFDGTHVMNGSANISTKANSRYAETRMVFWNNPEITGAFEAEFGRLWNHLGVVPE